MTKHDERDWIHGEIALMVDLAMAEKRLADLTVDAWNALPDARDR